MKLIFGRNVPPDLDLDDDAEFRAALKKAAPFQPDEVELALFEVVARQILEGAPSLVWETAQRLHARGLGRRQLMLELALAAAPAVTAAIGGDPGAFGERYARSLQALPMATERDIEDCVRSLLSSNERMTLDQLHEQALAGLDVSELIDEVTDLIESVTDRMLMADELQLVAGDIVLDPEQLCRGIVLTTRVTPDWPALDTDLAGLSYLTDDVADPPIDTAPGQLLQGRLQNGEVVFEAVHELPLDAAFVDAIRQAYALESEETGLPQTFRELTMHLLADDPSVFDQPRLPLTEAVTAAGLEIRGPLVADGRAAWRAQAHSLAAFRIVDLAANDEEQRDALDVYGLFERLDLGEPDITPAELRRALDLLTDESVLVIVTDQLFGYDDDPDSLDAAEVFARRLSAAASRPVQRSAAGVLTAMVAERRCDPLAAAEALAEAVRQAPDFFPAVDRLAWTRADQGRAAEAKSLWAQVFTPGDPDLAALETATGGQGNPGAGMRRNEPCWCGSGRKYKVCHLRANELPPLPDRFQWLLRKNIAYVERRGAPLNRVVMDTAWKLAGGDAEKLAGALKDSLVLDVVLHELGWFDRFLAERGALLPEDEQLVYASWQLIPRTVYEIVDVKAGESLQLRDVRSGELSEIAERLGSRDVSVGQFICARAVPDGRGHRLVGAVISVPPGREDAFLDIVDDPDPVSLADRLLAQMAAASRPPELTTTTGAPMTFCTRVLSVEDPEWLRLVLDRHYVAAGTDRWHQERSGAAGNLVLATLTLDGLALTVETMSEYRFHDIVVELSQLLPDAMVVSETLEPFEVAAARGAPEPAAREPVAAEAKAALAEWLSQQEELWCAESVPALGGLTPREAAEDPTQRERVIRLIDSFPPGGGVTDEGSATMRPDRLRELLGI
jgi:SEC-C motif